MIKTVRSCHARLCLVFTLTLLVQSTNLVGMQLTETARQDGKFVSTAKSQLVMTDWDGKERTFNLQADAKCTLDGQECRLDTLKSGTRIRIAMTSNEPVNVVRVEAIAKDEAFADSYHDGSFVSLTRNQLVMADAAGKEHTHSINSKIKMTLDTKKCEATDVKSGNKIRVFTVDPFSDEVVRVEALDNHSEFASDRQEGKLVSAIGTNLVMTNLDGKERTLTLPRDTVMTLDGKPCKVADLKPGTRVRITTRDAYSLVATQIEGLKSNQDFALDTQRGLKR